GRRARDAAQQPPVQESRGGAIDSCGGRLTAQDCEVSGRGKRQPGDQGEQPNIGSSNRRCHATSSLSGAPSSWCSGPPAPAAWAGCVWSSNLSCGVPGTRPASDNLAGRCWFRFWLTFDGGGPMTVPAD